MNFQVIKKPKISEKALSKKEGIYVFEVDKRSSKRHIKEAIEKQFNVQVVQVATMIIKGKVKRVGKKRIAKQLPSLKKAEVRLKDGQKIDLFTDKKEQK